MRTFMKNKKGAAMEWAIVFGLVIFALIALLISSMSAARIETKTAQAKFTQQTNLSQLGEYFIRCCGKSASFPKGTEENWNSYQWMDADAKQFFTTMKEKGYTYVSEVKTEYEDALHFYTESAYARKLTVNKNGSEVMTIIVEESIDYDTKSGFLLTFSNNGSSRFRVVDWSVVDIDEEFETETIGLLKGIWKAIGGGLSKLIVKTEESKYYTLDYSANGGELSPDAPYRVLKGESFYLPPVVRDGYQFNGWKDESGASYSDGVQVTPTKNKTFTAQWKAWTVTYNANGGNAVASTEGMVAHLPTPTNNDPIKKFAGWKSSLDNKVYAAGAKFVPTANVTLTAQWTNLATYRVSYVRGEATDGSSPADQTKIQGKDLALQTNYGNLIKTADSVPGDQWTVTFNANGGTGGGTKSANTSETIAYTFEGWTSNGTDLWPAGNNYTVDSAITLKPRFKAGTSTVVANEVDIPSPGTKTGYDFGGWKKSDGTILSTSATKYRPTSNNETLTAVWNSRIYTVTGSVTDGSGSFGQSTIANVPYGSTFSVSGRVLTVKNSSGTQLGTLTASASTGYNNNSYTWSATSGTITGPTTVSVSFAPNTYKVTLNTDGATASLSYADVTSYDASNVKYGKVLKLVVSSYSYTTNRSISFSVSNFKYYSNANCTTATTSTNPGTYYFKMPNSAVTVTVKSATSCFAAGTMITLADGTQKAIEDLTFDNQIMAWDFFTGQYVAKDIAILVDHGESTCDVVNLTFEDGRTLRIIGEHGVFDVDANRYAYITPDNCREYIGHRFSAKDGDTFKALTLTDAVVTTETGHAYSITSAGTSNALASELVTVAPPDDFYNWIDMAGTMRYDAQQFAEDVARYGTYDYDVFADYVTYEQYVAFNGAYLKVGVEKGCFTFRRILELIEEYQTYMPQ